MTPLRLGPGDGEPGVEFDLDAVAEWRIREIVRGMLAPQTGVIVEDAVQVVDELVSNAWEHGRPPRRCRVSMPTGPPRLRVEVDDSGAGEPRIRTPDSSGGRGMILVDQLARAWGVARRDGFKTVWAEVSLDRPRYPPACVADS
ncbi:ATP-binding protein [Nocardia sp. NPDC004068]|uniref:ATP-binding protein n=1 Tax=Nocardia sp. NPDC004068 TaxID=3364303 RepID=UPI003697B552